MYTGWVLHTDAGNSQTYAIIFDKTKSYCPEEEKPAGAAVVEDDMSADDKSTNDTLASIANANSEHTPIICRIYKGMNMHRHMWRAYLLILDREKDFAERIFQISIKSQPVYAAAAADGVSANANIFEPEYDAGLKYSILSSAQHVCQNKKSHCITKHSVSPASWTLENDGSTSHLLVTGFNLETL